MNEEVLDRFKVTDEAPEVSSRSVVLSLSTSTDPILYWNAVALEADRVSHTVMPNEQPGPVLSARALAIVHLAMYDAYAAIQGDPATLPAYLPNLPAPPPSASAAAIAAAAHTALSALYPSQRPFFDDAYTSAGLSGSLIPGHTFGQQVAERMLADRHADPSVSDSIYTPSLDRGAHRVDPDNPDPPHRFYAPFYGARSRGFAITARHELAAPPFDEDEYLEALRQVREKGIAPELTATLPPGSSPRTPVETLIGIYWAYDGAIGLGTPPRLYNQIVREVAKAQGNDVTANARLFSFVNAAMADAGILAWDQKYLHDLWRPVIGVRDNALDGDPFWLPLGAPRTNGSGKNFTPDFPAYPSGHATFGAAALHITRLFYGKTGRGPDNLFNDLSFVSEELNDVNRDVRGTVRPRHARSFPDGLWGMILENGLSRVLLGVHWAFDAFAVDEDGNPNLDREVNCEPIGGVPLGLEVAEDIFAAGGGKAPQKSNVPPRP